MATDVTMPRLSDSMEEGTVLKWLVEQGGEVQRGRPLVEIETDKANMTYEADTDGVLVEVLAQEGDTLEVGQPIARIGTADEAGGDGAVGASDAVGGERPPSGRDRPPDERPEEPGRQRPDSGRDEPTGRAPGPTAEPGLDAPGAPTGTEASQAPPAPAGNGGERVKASPIARRIAGELGVELGQVQGSGPGGRVVKADVEAAAERGPEPAEEARPAATAEPEATEAPEREEAPVPATTAPAGDGTKGETSVEELSRLQRTVSRRMAESKATVPDFSLEVDVDMTLCIELRDRLKSQTEQPPSYNDMVVKAAALALRDHPRVNGAYRDGHFESYSRVNVGVAVAAKDALVVPVVHDADQKSLGEISRQARRMIERVRDGSVTPPELSGATFTVSNLGMFGIQRFTAIINPPQAAILSVGALTKRPAVDERGRVVARDLMTLTLACDHRILYGADGAEFLAQVGKLLEQPLALAL